MENLFGGVIHYGNSDGIVEMIGPRSSRICGLDGTLTTVPNSDLSKMHITNDSMRNKCFFHHVLGVRYETTPEQFDGLLSDLRNHIAAHSMVEETSDMQADLSVPSVSSDQTSQPNQVAIAETKNPEGPPADAGLTEEDVQ